MSFRVLTLKFENGGEYLPGSGVLKIDEANGIAVLDLNGNFPVRDVVAAYGDAGSFQPVAVDLEVAASVRYTSARRPESCT